MKDYQREFIEFSISCGALKFGNFSLNSGRPSPYFYNAGEFCTGARLKKFASYLSAALIDSKVEFDVIFGPAYKGIPLVTALAEKLYSEHGIDVPFCFNRKEVKDHGEGGSLVGGSLEDRKIVIVDDVLTSGKAILKSYNLISECTSNSASKVTAVLVSLDRSEKSLDGTHSAAKNLEEQLKTRVVSIVNVKQLIEYISTVGGMESQCEIMKEYYSKWAAHE